MGPSMRGSSVELFEDCPACRLEGGLVETYDASVPSCRFGVPARVACKLCGLAQKGVLEGPEASPDPRGVAASSCPSCLAPLDVSSLDLRRCSACGARARLEESRAARRFATLDELREALDSWALREGFPTRKELVFASLAVRDEAQLFALYQAGQLLETVADPFAFGGRAASGVSAPRPPPSSSRPPPSFRVVPGAKSSPEPSANQARSRAEEPPPPSAPPRAILRPLVSVIAADGELHPDERALVDAFLASEGLSPLSEDEFRVYTPSETARHVPPEKREKIVQLMCEVAMIDGLADEAEVRVVRAYAGAWQVPEEKVDIWLWGYEHASASPARQFWLKIRRFVLSSRWEREDP